MGPDGGCAHRKVGDRINRYDLLAFSGKELDG
jgi:hypothetical protein